MSKKYKLILLSVILLFLVLSCYNTQINSLSTAPKASNFSSLYNPGESLINPEYRVYLKDRNEAVFYFRLETEAIKKALADAYPNVNMSVKYVLRENGINEIADSSSYSFDINLDSGNSFILDSFNIKLPYEKSYRLTVNFSNIPQTDSKIVIAYVNNSSPHSKENFLLKSISNNEEKYVFNNFVKPNGLYKIITNSLNNSSCEIEYYKTPEYSVIPPYNTSAGALLNKKYIPDTVFKYNMGDTIKFKAEGFYLLKNENDSTRNLCLLNSGDNFPNVKTIKDMLEPLKLFTAQKGYNKIISSENIKDAVEDYWFSRSGNSGFAKEQIRVYYNRVQLANLYFSTNIEGWKTDRGNIYVIFGAPSIINISAESEEWFYGENPNLAGLLFIFKKTASPYSDNNYVLQRDELYQSTWGHAISTWSNGKIFSISK